MWNKNDAFNYCYQNSNGVDDKSYLSSYLTWCEQVFSVGDLFVTLNCPTVRDVSTFVHAKTSAIEKRVNAKDPRFRLYRIALIVRKPQLHAHLILSSTAFTSDKYKTFRHLVKEQFQKALPRTTDVDVQVIDDIFSVTRYSLLKQEECVVDARSLYLPPYESCR